MSNITGKCGINVSQLFEHNLLMGFKLFNGFKSPNVNAENRHKQINAEFDDIGRGQPEYKAHGFQFKQSSWEGK